MNLTHRLACIATSLLPFLVLPIHLPAQPQPSRQKQAAAALLREDYSGAETMLRAELKLHPTDAETLSLLGMALDGEKKSAEADALHHRAMTLAPRSATILARYAQHLLEAGDPKGAQETFLRALALDPHDRFANLQLAQWALRQKDPNGALAYLNSIPAAQQEFPEVAVQKLVALDSIPADRKEADALFTRLAQVTERDAGLGSSIGWTLAQAGQFDRAETFLTHAHAADPSDFHVLYDLGVVALYAGHNERARDVLETAVREQPQNVDVLYSLAFVESALHQPEAAIRWLAQAGQLAPERADVQRLLAVTANELGAWEDSAAAWDRYAKLAPNDDEARRERGFATAHMGKFEAGMADLDWYVSRHPKDAMGFYELGVAQSANDPTQGIANLDKALALKSDFPAARAVRGSLYYTQGKPETALPDLEAVAGETQDAAVLDRLGQTYLALDRLTDAIRVLRKAVAMQGDTPTEPTAFLHLANALAEAGQTAESESFLERYRQARPAQGPVGLVHFLSLTPEQQRTDYQTRVEKAIKDNPKDVVAQSNYLKLMLEENQMDRAAAIARVIEGLTPGAGVLADDGRALLEAKQFAPAKALLEDAAATGPAAGVDVDLAIATFQAQGRTAGAAVEGLRQLERAPDTVRNAGYYLAQAQMLNASGKVDQALMALDQAIRADPARADLYWEKGLILSRNQRVPEALRLLDNAAKSLPREPRIPLAKAAVLELSGKTDDAMRVLDEVQRTWPEVAGVWVARGLIFAAQRHVEEARSALETAANHGARSPEAWAALADMTLQSAAPGHIAAAADAISQALRLAPEDAAIQALAARVRSGSSSATEPGVNPLRLFESRPPRDW